MASLVVALGVALVAAPSPALAGDCDTSWASPTDGDWNVEANWDNGLPGVNGPNVCIDAPGTYTVRIGADENDSANATAGAGHLFLGGSSGEQTLEVKGVSFYDGSAFHSVDARLSLESGRISSNGKLLLDGSRFPNYTDGQPGVRIDAPGGITNDGTIVSDPGFGGERTIAGSLCNRGIVSIPNYYSVADGARNGKLDLTGDYFQAPAGTLEVAANGSVTHYSPHWSELGVGGTAHLDGTLGVDGGNTVPDQRFRIISAADRVVGDFSTVVMRAVPTQNVEYGDDYVDLVATDAAPPADDPPPPPDDPTPVIQPDPACVRAHARVDHARNRLARARAAHNRHRSVRARIRLVRARVRMHEVCPN